MEKTPHTTHRQVLQRLRRASGHLTRVIAMIEGENPCTPTARQLYAVERAITKAKQLYIGDHIDHCVGEDAAWVADVREIIRYL